MNQNIKYVVVEQHRFSGRSVALRGLSFETAEAAQAHINTAYKEQYRSRFHVESRTVKADDTALRMTCQCCGGKFLANTGSVAHHGYTRPGWGWQTASCSGAKELPFEADRAKLGSMITFLKKHRQDLIHARQAVTLGTAPIIREYKIGLGRQAEKHSFAFTRENFGSEEARLARRSLYVHDFDRLLEHELSKRDNQIRHIGADIASQQTRFDGWVQTHTWNGKIKSWDRV